MKLRERLLLLLTPLVLLPLVLSILFSLFFLQKTSPVLAYSYGLFSFIFVGILAILIIPILVGLSNSIVRPIQSVIDNAKKISQGDLDHDLRIERTDDETGQLIAVIEEMKASLYQQKKAVEAAAALSAIGQQAAQVAHDIRGPISAIRASIDYFLARSAESPEFLKHVDLLTLSTRRLFNIADDLVKKYRGEEERRCYFSLHHVLDNLLREYESQSSHGAIRFNRIFHLSDICIFQERVSVEHIFANLIKNGLEAIGLHGILEIKTEVKNEFAVVKIRDDGCGIEKEKLPLIFGDRYTSGKEGGTGLGLAYVQKNVEKAGGKICVQSKLGEGATFEVKLPIAKNKDLKTEARIAMDELKESASSSNRGAAFKIGGYNVLVIDDDAAIRFAWELMSRKLQIEKLKTFPNWEAFESSGTNPSEIDIAFVDKNIAGSKFSGAEVLSHLKRQGIPKVVLASGENSEELKNDPQFAAADFVIQDKIPNSFKGFFVNPENFSFKICSESSRS